MKKLLIIFSLLCTATFVIAQRKVVPIATKNFEAKYNGGDIILSYTYNAARGIDSIAVKIYRKNGDKTILLKQQTTIAANKKWQFADTTIRKKEGIYQYQIIATINNEVVQNNELTVYAFAPDKRPFASKLKAQNKKNTNEIALTWKVENKATINSINILRSRKKEEGYTLIKAVQNTDTIYFDAVDDANEPFFYKLEMVSLVDGKTYSSAAVFVVPDFEIMPSPVTNVKALQTNKSITISWINNDVKARGFYVTKRIDSKANFTNASNIITTNARGNNYQYIDTTNLMAGQMYEYAIVSESNSFTKSAPSDTVTVGFKNVITSLAPPQNVTIITANDTTYYLAWSIDSSHINYVAGYAVFVKTVTDREYVLLQDSTTQADVNYVQIPKPIDGNSYKVQAINGEFKSQFSTAFTYNNAFEKEFGPIHLKAAVIDNAVIIKWLAYNTEPIKEYKLYKFNGRDYELIETISADKNMVTTKKYNAGQLNLYKLKTVKQNLVESNGSKVLQVN